MVRGTLMVVFAMLLAVVFGVASTTMMFGSSDLTQIMGAILAVAAVLCLVLRELALLRERIVEAAKAQAPAVPAAREARELAYD
jgi:hypothetical protein